MYHVSSCYYKRIDMVFHREVTLQDYCKFLDATPYCWKDHHCLAFREYYFPINSQASYLIQVLSSSLNGLFISALYVEKIKIDKFCDS